MRIGHGFDLHRLEPLSPAGRARPLLLAGVPIESPLGCVAHSDGDTLFHAVTDALLGALALPDIGELFPDSAPENAGRASREFLDRAMSLVRGAGYSVGNLDATVVLERPRIAPYKERVRAALAAALDVPTSAVNVKGKSHEKVDAVGEGRAIEAHAVVILFRPQLPP